MKKCNRWIWIQGSISCFGSSPVSVAFVYKRPIYNFTATENEFIVYYYGVQNEFIVYYYGVHCILLRSTLYTTTEFIVYYYGVQNEFIVYYYGVQNSLMALPTLTLPGCKYMGINSWICDKDSITCYVKIYEYFYSR